MGRGNLATPGKAPLEAAMTEIQERRAEGAGRVRVETLVEVCGNEPGIPAFEAEAVDVSARGMHLRTAYLPDSGAPLVCRFEEGGREIVVEGRVAWRREGSRGGEFGVEFTALDSGSVGALREPLHPPEAGIVARTLVFFARIAKADDQLHDLNSGID